MKRKTLILFTIFFLVAKIQAQDSANHWFDFWVGEWGATWDEGGGKKGGGTNSITRILDNKAIQENFVVKEGASKGYLGTSISIYNEKNNTWHQGYADNQSAYFNFTGERLSEKRIFKTFPVMVSEKEVIQRMVFYDIQKDSFTWDWEKSEDGGKSWQLNWRIFYKRLQ